jgi:outer membrane receptor protein involved in Fe transport
LAADQSLDDHGHVGGVGSYVCHVPELAHFRSEAGRRQLNDVGSVAGNDLIQAPRQSADIGAQYDVASAYGAIDFSLNWRYTSKYYWDPDSRLTQPETSIVSASVKYEPNSRWDIRVWGANLPNQKYFLNATDQSALA